LPSSRYFYYACIAFCILLIPVNVWSFGKFVELDEREVEATVAYGNLNHDSSTAGATCGTYGDFDGLGDGGWAGESGSKRSDALDPGGKCGSGLLPSIAGDDGSSGGDGALKHPMQATGGAEEENGVGPMRPSGASSSGRGSSLRHRPSGGGARGSSLIGGARGSAGRYSMGGVGGGGVILTSE